MPVTDTATYGLSGYWALSFFVQLGLGNARPTDEHLLDAAVFSLGEGVSPLVEADSDRNGHDRVQLSFTQPDQATLERALNVGVEAVRTALETAGIETSAITRVVAVGYGDLEADNDLVRYEVTQRAMEIEMAIVRVADLEIDSLNGGLGRT